jgi:hypothetical protein
MEYEIMFFCNSMGIVIIGMIMLYHLIGIHPINISYVGVKDEKTEY